MLLRRLDGHVRVGWGRFGLRNALLSDFWRRENRALERPALTKAVDKFDYKRGYKFSTYATWWIRQAKEPISLETLIGEGEDSHLGGFIEDKSAISPADAVISIDLAEQTPKVLATLTPREEKVLRMRFGIGEKSDHTLEEVGQDFEVTRERIRQIEAKARRKLQHPSRSKRLKPFMAN